MVVKLAFCFLLSAENGKVYKLPQYRRCHGGFGVSTDGRVLYGVRMKCSQLFRFDLQTGRPLRSLKVVGMSAPSDILNVDSTLYITECTNREPGILKISPPPHCNSGAKISSHKLTFGDNSFIPFALDLSLDRKKLLVTLRYQGDFPSGKDKYVIFCDLNGQNIQRLKLPEFIEDPQHIIEDPVCPGTYFLLHRPPERRTVPVNSIYKVIVEEDRLVVSDVRDYDMKINENLDGGHMTCLPCGQLLAVGWKSEIILDINNDLSGFRILKDDERRVHRPCRIRSDVENDNLIKLYVVMSNDVVRYQYLRARDDCGDLQPFLSDRTTARNDDQHGVRACINGLQNMIRHFHTRSDNVNGNNNIP